MESFKKQDLSLLDKNDIITMYVKILNFLQKCTKVSVK